MQEVIKLSGVVCCTVGRGVVGLDRLRLWLYGCSLRLQMALRGRNHRKYAQLERRLRTVRGTYVDEPNAVFVPVGGKLHRRI